MIPGPGRWRRGSSSRLDGGMFIIVILMLCYLMLSFTGMVMRNNEHPNPIAIDSIITSTSPAAYQRVAYNTTMTNNNASMPDAKWVMVMSSHYEEYADVAYSNARAYAKKHGASLLVILCAYYLTMLGAVGRRYYYHILLCTVRLNPQRMNSCVHI